MEMLHGVWKQHLRARAVVGYGVKSFLPSPSNYVTRSPGYVVGIENFGTLLCQILSTFCIIFHTEQRQREGLRVRDHNFIYTSKISTECFKNVFFFHFIYLFLAF